MAFNPMAFITPEQREQLAKIQKFTEKVKYTVHTDAGRVEFTLETDDPEAARLIPQIQEGIINTVTQLLYTTFNMSGERI